MRFSGQTDLVLKSELNPSFGIPHRVLESARLRSLNCRAQDDSFAGTWRHGFMWPEGNITRHYRGKLTGPLPDC